LVGGPMNYRYVEVLNALSLFVVLRKDVKKVFSLAREVAGDFRLVSMSGREGDFSIFALGRKIDGYHVSHRKGRWHLFSHQEEA